MKLTKYEHACFTVEKDDQMLVVDPGGFSSDFMPPEQIIGIVITHAHGDHLDHDRLAMIIDKNPDAIVIGPEAAISSIEVFSTRVVNTGDHLTVGPFDLAFFGGEHAVIHKDIPLVANLGVMINDLLYYPGDSLTLPDVSIDTLAVPAAAPWLKLSEAMDFLVAAHPRLAFPTHDAILSQVGKEMIDRILGGVASNNGIEYKRLEAPLEI
jgi:L-ascorbate metabolism protein UlaG (beta-lactamase superfamily)